MIIRMAVFLCHTKVLPRPARLCSDCFDTLRHLITASFRMESNRVSCDACQPRKGQL
jgi:hypothetical protein